MLTPPRIHAADIGHGTTAVLVVRTSTWVWLDETSVRIWQAALTSSLPELEEEFVAEGYHREQVHEAVQRNVRDLTDYRLLETALPAWRARLGRRPRRKVVA
ncbi:hypothetical protein [Streptomyces lunalinharesii]|uniref:Uncharacterized protein n=1 Tax=Streptomyces lunalinharesii TaxID=333384 RepID=A0ABN3T675_9ACTN